MKQFKFIFSTLIVTSSIFLTTGCLDTLTDTETGNTIIIEDVADSVPSIKTLEEAAGLFRTTQATVIEVDKHKYQAQFNLHMDNYCGYLCLPHSFYGRQPSTYSISVYGYGVTERFLNFCQQVTPILKSSADLGVPELGALGEIMFALGSHIMADSYGAFPYQHYKKQNQAHPIYYYSGEMIYDSIFHHLKNSVEILETYKNKPDTEKEAFQKILNDQDCVSGKNVDNWIKFANSLRLRLAMRMTNVDPARAQLEAEAAIAAGVLTESDKDFAFDVNQTAEFAHPLYKIAIAWVDTRLNASFLNILERLQCPLLSEWFKKNAGQADKAGDVIAKDGTIYPADSHYMGIRSGTPMRDQGYATDYINYSTVGSGFAFKNISWMKVSEVLFLRAEGALRGWNMGGSAKDFYNQALNIGLKREITTGRPATIQAKIDAYLAVDKADTTIDYVDYYDPENNCKGQIEIGVTWNDGDSYETKLEKIITQKYILNFPVSIEAWSDLRRTGYPRQLPMVEDGGDGSIQGGIISRIPFSIYEDEESKEDADYYGVNALGGPDWQGTPIWWDR